MGVQKTYGYATSKGVAGGIYDMFHYPVDSRFNEEATGKLHFGVGVVTGKVPGQAALRFRPAQALLITSRVLSSTVSTASRIWRGNSTS